jgi:hypothetical protein
MPSRTPSRTASSYNGIEPEEADADIDDITNKLQNAYAAPPKKKRSYKKKDCERSSNGRCVRTCKYGARVNGKCPRPTRCKPLMKRDPITGVCQESAISKMRRKIKANMTSPHASASRYDRMRAATLRRKYKAMNLLSPQSRKDEEELDAMGL